MRTVTFSNERVGAFVRRAYVPSWKNIRPEVPFREGLYAGWKGERTVSSLQPGDGSTNICALIVTPAGQIVHAIQGYMEADEFLRELEFGVKAARLAGEGNAPERLRALYAERLKESQAKTRSGQLLQSNLRAMEQRPLPALENLLPAKRAGLDGR